jgi:cell division protein FtsB
VRPRPGQGERIRSGRPRAARGVGTSLLWLVAASLVGWTVVGFALEYVRTYTLAREAVRLEERRQALVRANAALAEEIQRLRTDDQYLEQLARQELGMLRPGEMELVIVPQTPARGRVTERGAEAHPVIRREDRLELLRGLADYTLGEIRDGLARLLHRFPRTTP